MDDPIRRPIREPLGEGTPESPRLVVDVWPALPTPEGWRVLLMRRSARKGGFWQGVSGRVEACDASLEAAALREIREETGLDEGVRVLDLGRWVEFTGPMSGMRFRKRSLGAIFPAGTTLEKVRISHEHTEARIVTFDEARALVPFPENRDEISRLEATVRRGPSAPARTP